MAAAVGDMTRLGVDQAAFAMGNEALYALEAVLQQSLKQKCLTQ